MKEGGEGEGGRGGERREERVKEGGEGEGGRGGEQTKRESRDERGQERLRVKLQSGRVQQPSANQRHLEEQH